MSEHMDKMHEVLDATNEVIPGSIAVGGCVRDALMGRPQSDFDFATHWLPEDIRELAQMAGRRTICVGQRFGTIKVKLMLKGEPMWVEVTTFRQDGPGRKPEVHFGANLHEDLSRRDFTINAMAITPDHTLVDPFCGADDIDSRDIRAVGSPRQRFDEDPLRIMRMFRFAAQLGFGIDPWTSQCAEDRVHKLLTISRERIVQEMDKLLMAPRAGHVLPWLWTGDVFKFIIPELQSQFRFNQHSPFHTFDLHVHTALTVDRAPLDVDTRWAALLHDVGKTVSAIPHPRQPERLIFPKHELIGAEIADGIARRLKFSTARRDFIVRAILTHMQDGSILKAADQAAKS